MVEAPLPNANSKVDPSAEPPKLDGVSEGMISGVVSSIAAVAADEFVKHTPAAPLSPWIAAATGGVTAFALEHGGLLDVVTNHLNNSTQLEPASHTLAVHQDAMLSGTIPATDRVDPGLEQIAGIPGEGVDNYPIQHLGTITSDPLHEAHSIVHHLAVVGTIADLD